MAIQFHCRIDLRELLKSGKIVATLLNSERVESARSVQKLNGMYLKIKTYLATFLEKVV